MDKVNVLVVSRLDLRPGFLEKIAAVDPRISAKDGMGQLVAELRGKGKKGPLVDLLDNELKKVPVQQSSGTQEDFDAMLAQADVIFGIVLFPENLLQRAPKLRWVHIGGTGIDLYLSIGIFDGGITVTNSRGSLAIPIAEHVLAFMLMLARDAQRLLDNKRNRLWDTFLTQELRDRTVGIIGLGAIGSEVARLTRGLGMRVLATRLSATRRESGISGLDELYPPSELHQMLAESDYVIVAVPLTEETRNMISEAELSTMKSTACLINIARGKIVDQFALIKALKEGWIAGAGLDVFDYEPLPTDSELWELPNVYLSSHAAGATDRRSERILGLFCDNLRRYLAGEQMLNVIDLEKKRY